MSARGRGEGRRGVVIAVISTIVVFAALGFAIVNAPGWPEVKAQFFDWSEFKATFPDVLDAFLLNVKLFCIAEVLILPLALLLLLCLELNQTQSLWLHVFGIVLIVGRIFHAIGLWRSAGASFGRMVGTALTWGVMQVMAVLLLWQWLMWTLTAH